MIVDTSGLLVFLDASAAEHDRVVEAMGAARGPLLLSPFVLAEVDHLVSTRFGTRTAREVLDDVADGAYRLEPMTASDVRAAGVVLDRYADLELGLADASMVVLAERHRMADVLTFDHRHFRAVTWGEGCPFRLLPADG